MSALTSVRFSWDLVSYLYAHFVLLRTSRSNLSLLAQFLRSTQTELRPTFLDHLISNQRYLHTYGAQSLTQATFKGTHQQIRYRHQKESVAKSVNVLKLKDVFILSGARTGFGSLNGTLAPLTAAHLGTVVTKEAIRRAKISSGDVKGTYVGSVLQAGQGENVARQVSIGAGIPTTAPCMTVNKVCSSGMTALILGGQAVHCGYHDVTVGVGTESMSNAPFYIPRHIPNGGVHLDDSIDRDGFMDPVMKVSVGVLGEKPVREYGITREQQDAWALDSYRKAAQAWKDGRYDEEVVTVEVPQKDGPPKKFREDEEIKRLVPEKVPKLKPMFCSDGRGTITAANAGGMGDGAAACVLASKDFIEGKGVRPMAQILAISESSLDPADFALAPPTAVKNMLDACGLSVDKIALWEVNEPFAMNALAFMKFFNNMSPHNINVKGGAVAIGHPLATNGTRIVVSLMYTLQRNELGVATICNGCGEGSAMLIKKL